MKPSLKIIKLSLNMYKLMVINLNSKIESQNPEAELVKEHMRFNVRHDLEITDESIEILWIEVQGRNKNTLVLIGAVYQPSSNETEKLIWLEKFERIFTEIYIKWSGVIVIAGEFNIDLLNGNKQAQRRYKDILHSFLLLQHITKATRKLKTLIDHVISTIPNGVIHHDIVHTKGISDHDTPYVIFNIKKEKYQPCYKFIRFEKTLDMNSYTSDFQQLPFNLVYSLDDPEDQVSIFNKLVVDCINTYAPLRKVKRTRPVAPWMNDPKIANLQKDLDTQRTIYRNHKSSSNHTNYQNTRKKIEKTIKETQASFLCKALSDKQPAKLWDTVDRISNKQHDRIKLHPSDINNQFIPLASCLTHKINEPYDFTEFFQNILDDVNPDMFKINHTNYDEVRKILPGIKNDCSTGHDDIPIRYSKPVADDVTSPLVHVINTCIDNSVFPSTWEIARVWPVPKVDHAKDVTEFRPISILCIISKVFDRVILHQLCHFLEVKAHCNQTQSRFRKGHSTTTLLLKLRDDIKRAMNTSEVTLGILLPYSKALNAIDHLTLLEKLHKSNFSVQALKLFHSYASERKQFVQDDDKSSFVKLNNFGLPQSSILGPVLFNLYIVNLIENVTCDSLQYADDSTPYKYSKPKNLKKMY